MEELKVIFSIYLHSPIAETLKCYGELSDVVNKILSLCEQGAIELIDMPKCPDRNGASRFDINVTSEYYISLVESFPPNSPRISLRRLLYWFVEQEMYDALEWIPTFPYISKEKNNILKKIGGIESDLHKLLLKLNEEEKQYCRNTILQLNELKEVIENGR